MKTGILLGVVKKKNHKMCRRWAHTSFVTQRPLLVEAEATCPWTGHGDFRHHHLPLTKAKALSLSYRVKPCLKGKTSPIRYLLKPTIL